MGLESAWLKSLGLGRWLPCGSSLLLIECCCCGRSALMGSTELWEPAGDAFEEGRRVVGGGRACPPLVREGTCCKGGALWGVMLTLWERAEGRRFITLTLPLRLWRALRLG